MKHNLLFLYHSNSGEDTGLQMVSIHLSTTIVVERCHNITMSNHHCPSVPQEILRYPEVSSRTMHMFFKELHLVCGTVKVTTKVYSNTLSIKNSEKKELILK